jgi:hypothetical protein
MRIVPLGEQLKDFADTAALLDVLDLLISVDTSVVHVAGALARPVWTLLAAGPDWRWMLNRDASPWYPTMRLFRRAGAACGREVIERVAAALREFVAGRRKRNDPRPTGHVRRVRCAWDALRAGFEYLAEQTSRRSRTGTIRSSARRRFRHRADISVQAAPRGKWEAHRVYADIQYVVSGEEKMGCRPLAACACRGLRRGS